MLLLPPPLHIKSKNFIESTATPSCRPPYIAYTYTVPQSRNAFLSFSFHNQNVLELPFPVTFLINQRQYDSSTTLQVCSLKVIFIIIKCHCRKRHNNISMAIIVLFVIH